MATKIGAGVSLNGLFVEDFLWPFNLKSGIVAADVGKAVAVDTDAANRVKLAGDGDVILGRLETVENRVQEGLLVGTVSIKGAYKFPVKTGETVIVGDRILGAGAGEVKAVAAVTDATVADIALSTSNTYTDAAVNTAVNAMKDLVVAALNAKKDALVALQHRTKVVEVGSGYCVAIVQ